jgi:SAM-dependent methyltransferase
MSFFQGFLDQINGFDGEDDALFSLNSNYNCILKQTACGCNGSYRKYVDVYRFYNNACPVLSDFIRGGASQQNFDYPPKTLEEVDDLEINWMANTSDKVIEAIIRSRALESQRKLLDVGGGDGSIAIELINQYHTLSATVFNLPIAKEVILKKFISSNCSGRVNMIEGNFFKHEFPKEYDTILFSRIVSDWSAEKCRHLFKNAKNALKPKGKVIIVDFCLNGNTTPCLVWEYRCLFIDLFETFLLKPVEIYSQLLRESGFTNIQITPMSDQSYYTVIQAEAP